MASLQNLFSLSLFNWNQKIRTYVFFVISCCSIEALNTFAVYPTGTSSASAIGNGQCNSLLCNQIGRTSSYASSVLVLSC
ncbi:hypothetical protein GmHk_04G011183 [Glycine max]|nr:hypothetical protein GmHk_04G011183 [Glycine max]